MAHFGIQGDGRRREIAIIGSGISGMSCAWLLNPAHDITVYEAADRIGGHSHTVEMSDGSTSFPVDTGFIVYNEPTYPNLTALFRELDVPTEMSDMSFAASLENGRLEYAGTGLRGLFAQKRNLVRPRFWSMLRDLRRLYAQAPFDPVLQNADRISLGEWLDTHRYGRAVQQDHLLPMAAAIWSTRTSAVRDYPAAAFFRFCDNHGLLRLTDRPIWRTVTGGSSTYVTRLTASYADRILRNRPVAGVRRTEAGIMLRDAHGETRRFDEVVFATSAPRALAMLEDASTAERALLGAVGVSANQAILHTDAALMPKRRSVWASWNFIGADDPRAPPCVTYWMNNLQNLPTSKQVFVTLNPVRPPAPDSILHTQTYEHPLFDVAAMQAQRRLWSIQGVQKTWFCGAWLGAGFHEDGVQSGLAVAEALGAPRRPWQVENESGRIHLGPHNACSGPARSRMSNAALYDGTVIHQRLRPIRHRLRYDIFMMLLDLDELPALARRLRFFSHDRFNLFSFFDSDHGAGAPGGLRGWLETQLRQANLFDECGAIRVLCMPRILGHAFNPISVFFCHRRDGSPLAMLYEVNNTFGERHSYLIPVSDPIWPVRQACEKQFYVSPFMPMELRYRFRVTQPGQHFSLAILASSEEGPMIATAFAGTATPVSDAILFRRFLRMPLLGAKTVAAIHLEALKLWLKGLKLLPRPARPADPVTITF